MARLGFNIDEIALLRETYKSKTPDPVTAAVIAEQAGAESIVCHLREDFAHINKRDIELLRRMTITHFNLRIAPNDDMIKTALKSVPDMVTLVQEKRTEKLIYGPLDIASNPNFFQSVIAKFRENGIVISCFIEPDISQIKTAAKIGSDYVDLSTFGYSFSADMEKEELELEKLKASSLAAVKLGLGINASGGLHYHNIGPIAEIDKIEELNVGHSIISKTILGGLKEAVRDMVFKIGS